jgi:hypothetical protein
VETFAQGTMEECDRIVSFDPQNVWDRISHAVDSLAELRFGFRLLQALNRSGISHSQLRNANDLIEQPILLILDKATVI